MKTCKKKPLNQLPLLHTLKHRALLHSPLLSKYVTPFNSQKLFRSSFSFFYPHIIQQTGYYLDLTPNFEILITKSLNYFLFFKIHFSGDLYHRATPIVPRTPPTACSQILCLAQCQLNRFFPPFSPCLGHVVWVTWCVRRIFTPLETCQL